MSGISFDNFFCLFQRTFPVQISKNLFVSKPLHGHHPSCIATFLKRRNFFYKSLLKHSIHSFVDSLIKIGPVIIQHKIGRIIGRFFFPFFGIVFGLMLLADGLTRVRIALDARPFGIRAWWLILVSAIATAILGVVLLFHPGEGTQVLTQLLGISLMVDGVMNISTILAAVRVIRAARPGDDGEDYELVDD